MSKQPQLKKESYFESGRFAVALIIGVSFILYWQTTSFGFVWDDLRTHFVGNKDFRSGNLAGLWNKPYEGMYIPFSYTFWLIVYKLTGGVKIPIPLYMHFANIAVHTLNCLLLFVLAKKISKNNFSSLIAALFFAVHPVQAETVAWVSELRGLLATCFMLAGMLIFYTNKAENKFTNTNFILVLLIGVMAMLSKPIAIIYPTLLFLFDYFLLKQFNKKNISHYVIIFLCLLPFAVFTSHLQPTVVEEMQYPLWLRFVLPFFSFAFYLFKLLLPFGYCASYAYTPPFLQKSFLLLTGAVLLSAIVIFYCYRKRKDNHMLLFALLFFVVGFLPVSGIITFYFQQFSNVADRYLYISLIGISLFLSVDLQVIQELYGNTKFLLIGLVAISTLSLINFAAQKKWKDDVALWEDANAKKPEQVVAWHNLGVAYLDQLNDVDKGLAAINQALKLNPSYDRALMNKANILARKGKLVEALETFTRVIELKPENGLAWYNRSLTFYQLKMFDKAQQDFMMAEKLGHTVNENYRSSLIKANEKK